MPIGTGHKRDDRRRRVLRDERTNDDESVAEGSKRRLGRRVRLRYGAAARRRHQPAIVDFLPIRWSALTLSLALVGLLMVSMIMGLVALAEPLEPGQALTRPTLLNDSFGLMSRVTAWIASLAAMVSAIVASQLFLIRRHRRDDYRGHYSVWRWVALLAVLYSAEISTGLGAELISGIAGRFLSANTAHGCWNLLMLILGTAVAARLFFELREHRVSTTLLLVSWLGWGATLVAPWFQPNAWWAPVAWASSDLVLSGSGLLTLLWHARCVIRDAATGGRRRNRVESEAGEAPEGAKPSRRSRRSTKKAVESSDENAASEHETAGAASSTSANTSQPIGASISRGSSAAASAAAATPTSTSVAKTVASSPVSATVRGETSSRPEPRSTPAAPSSRPVAEASKGAVVSQEVDDDEDEEDDSDASADASTAGMSKAQRRKLAKQQRRQQRNAA